MTMPDSDERAFLPSEESIDRLHRSGWTTGEASFIGPNLAKLSASDICS